MSKARSPKLTLYAIEFAVIKTEAEPATVGGCFSSIILFKHGLIEYIEIQAIIADREGTL